MSGRALTVCRPSGKPSPDDRKRELTKGIALALCELDRVIRAERREHADD